MLSRPLPTVHLLCGLNASGKTTLAKNLAAALPAVRFSLDEWMLGLFDLRYDEPEYAKARDRCSEIIWQTAVQVLDLGCDVVLDWN
jgi:predicted kinase